MTDAIHVGPDAHLEFQRLHVPNSGNRKLRNPTARTRLHVAGAFALWPSVTLARNSQVRSEGQRCHQQCRIRLICLLVVCLGAVVACKLDGAPFPQKLSVPCR